MFKQIYKTCLNKTNETCFLCIYLYKICKSLLNTIYERVFIMNKQNI